MEREERIVQLLELHFEAEADYSRVELEGMDDDELVECYNAEIVPATDTQLDLEKCVACGQMKVCPFMDDTNSDPVCQQCADEAESDNEIITQELGPEEDENDEEDDDEEDEDDDDEDDEDDLDEEDE